jgi:hypothetical protein
MTDKSAEAPAPDPGVCRWPDCLHTAKGQCKTDTTITRLTAEVERLKEGRETMGNLWARERAARVAAEAEVGWLEAARGPEMADEITNLRAAISKLIGTNRMLKQQVEDRDTTITRLTAEVERLRAALAITTEGLEWCVIRAEAMATPDVDAGNFARVCLDKARTALKEPRTPTHRHIKRGSTYTAIAVGTAQTADKITDNTPVVIYRAEDGSWWVRPQDEFNDGRFEALKDPRT